jgi:DNA-binding NarL/FixJ family response regulator
MNKVYKIGIVDDHDGIRKTIAQAIRENCEFEISIEAGNGMELIRKVSQIPASDIPDVLLIDINMPLMDGFETVSWVKSHLTETKMLIMSVYTDEEKVVRLIKMGVNGYLPKSMGVKELYDALSNIIRKGFHYSEFIAEKLLESMKTEIPGYKVTSVEVKGVWNSLTENEKRLAQLCCTELTYEEIAKEMSLTAKSVEGQRKNLFSKCRVNTRVGLVMFLFRNKFIE